MYTNNDRLIIFDADGTLIDAFSAIDRTFSLNGMDIGKLENFQRRRKLLKYLGGIKEFPINLRKQFGKQNRKALRETLTEVYREEALLYPGLAQLMKDALAVPGLRVGLVTRNVTIEPAVTLGRLFARHDIDLDALDYVAYVPLGEPKSTAFREARQRFDINPARAYACGDEHKDYLAAIETGLHPFVVSYGFEDHLRLTEKFLVPEEVISRTPADVCDCIRHGLEITSGA
ncbi:HAD family hydrolase [Actimicrobium antarcticum]|uniref:phosphoglycolate phosphatase n=1 Tax=Actimicrobium antarcticum TaxID=1051899 RepID=A0ABP7TUS6_9BURK